jgi:hypothetical protein
MVTKMVGLLVQQVMSTRMEFLIRSPVLPLQILLEDFNDDGTIDVVIGAQLANLLGITDAGKVFTTMVRGQLPLFFGANYSASPKKRKPLPKNETLVGFLFSRFLLVGLFSFLVQKKTKKRKRFFFVLPFFLKKKQTLVGFLFSRFLLVGLFSFLVQNKENNWP